jgi:DNA uptake protein ComE-like DNA-binding protein
MTSNYPGRVEVRLLLDINTVSEREIEVICCQMGPSISSAIIEQRKKFRRIRSLEQLRTPGLIAEKRMRQLYKYFYVAKKGQVGVFVYEKRNINTEMAADMIYHTHGIDTLTESIRSFIIQKNGIQSINELKAIPYIGSKRIKSLQEEYYCGEYAPTNPDVVVLRNEDDANETHINETDNEDDSDLDDQETDVDSGSDSDSDDGSDDGGDDLINKIDLNNASKTDLMTLPRIGKALADNILQFRKNQRFQTVRDILRVKRIGEGILNTVKDLICV